MSDRKDSSDRRDESMPLIAKELTKDCNQSNAWSLNEDVVNRRLYKRRISVNTTSNKALNITNNELKSSLKRASLTFASTETQLFECLDSKPIASTHSKSYSNFGQRLEHHNLDSLRSVQSFTRNKRNVCSDSNLYTINHISNQFSDVTNNSQTEVCFKSLSLFISIILVLVLKYSSLYFLIDLYSREKSLGLLFINHNFHKTLVFFRSIYSS